MKKLLFISFSILFCLTNQAQIITTVAGGGNGDGGSATNTSIDIPLNIALDGSGNLFVIDYYNHRIRKVNVITGIISTVAGNGIGSYGGDGGAATAAFLNYPTGITIDSSGNLYIADRNNNRIRKVNAITGIISTIAGNGIQAYGGDGGSATSAYLSYPTGVAVDGLGNLYIADRNNNRIRKVNASNGVISTIAGIGTAGYSGDGATAIAAILNQPTGVAFYGSNNLYIADADNNRIRKVNVSTGIITTVAGNGTYGYGGDSSLAITANFKNPRGIAVDGSGNLFIGDYYNHRIRKVNSSTGIISTVAGNGIAGYGGDGITAITANLNFPNGSAIDGVGNLYIADASNFRVRKVNTSTSIISTVVGNGTGFYGGDGEVAISAKLSQPHGVCMDGSSNLFIADVSNNRIRKVNANTGIITTVAGNGNYGYGGDSSLAIAANLKKPGSIAIDNSGNLYIADTYNNRVRKVNANTGIIYTIAGNGTNGFGGDGGAATSANLSYPFDLAIDGLGNLFIADYGNNRIRKVNVSTGIISTVAGNGIGSYGGDGGSAIAASLYNPIGISIDNSSNIFIADYLNNRIRKVNASNGIISTIAGNGTAGYGGDSAVATSANINQPTGVDVDDSGNVYIADNANDRIRKIIASTGVIYTIVGNGIGGYAGDGGEATLAYLNGPNGIMVDGSGKNIMIGDSGNDRIRKVSYGIFNNIITGNQTICFGKTPDSLIGNIPIGGNGIYTYTWLKSTTSAISGYSIIPASNTISYKPTAFSQNTWYKRFVVSSLYTDSSSAVLITVNPNPNPLVGFTINNAIQCLNGNNFLFTDTSTISSGTITRKWNFGSGNNDTSTIANPSKVFINTNTYIIKLVETSNTGCKDSVSKIISVNPKPLVGFIVNNTSQCVNGNSFMFADTSNITFGSISRKWNFGTGNNDTSTLLNQTKVYSTANTYNVKLVATSNNGCKDSVSKMILVNPKPLVGFTVNNTSQCVNGNNFMFADTSTITFGSISRKWNFGTGNNDTSTQSNHTKTYLTSDTYSVKLIVASINGCKDSIIKTIIVNPKPNVGFTINNSIQCLANNNFLYTDTSTIVSGTITRKWNFGNGNNDTSTISNQTKVYSTANTYSVKLFTTSNNGCKDSIIKSILINASPITGFIINNPSQCVNGNNFSFTDTSSISSGTITRKWNLGTGVNDTSLLLNPNKVYSTANTYAVKLIISSNNGCKDSVTKNIMVNPKPIVAFTSPTLFCISNSNTSLSLTNNTSISSGSLSYNWQFSDNSSSNSLNPIKTISDTGNLVIKLIATSNNNCKDSITKTTIVNFKPNAGFTINNPIQCLTGNNFLFIDTSAIAAGNITRKWNFGTGMNDTSLLVSLNKVYSTANIYVVKLITTSYNGCKDSITKNVSVITKPTANFIINNLSQCLKNNNFIFTNQSTTGFNYSWKFGNGDSSNVVSPNYNYANAGTNSVKLIVSDNNNCKDSISKNIIVNANAKANFTINKDTQNFVGNNFIFTNTSTNSNNQTWNFGDSTNSTLLNPNKSYTSFGNKTIKLISNNAANCPDTINKSVFVNARPTIGNILGNANPTSLITPYSYSVLSQANIVYNWSAINGTIQTGQGTNSITVVWNSKGTGNLNAKITNSYNLSDSTNLLVNITSVGINNLSLDNDLKVYPNPTKNSITITNKPNLLGKKYIITNLVGQTVLNGKLNLDETIVNLESLQSGVYLLSIDGLNKQSIKVIKE